MNELRVWRRYNSQSNPGAAPERREIESRIRAVEARLKIAMRAYSTVLEKQRQATQLPQPTETAPPPSE